MGRARAVSAGTRPRTGTETPAASELTPASRQAAPSRGRREASAPAPRDRATSRRGIVPDLDRVIHERLRLAIVSALAATDKLSFRDLKTMLRASDGNLSVHARKLEEAGYVACRKSFDGRVPRTEFRLTAEGRRAFERYLDHLESLVHHARNRT